MLGRNLNNLILIQTHAPLYDIDVEGDIKEDEPEPKKEEPKKEEPKKEEPKKEEPKKEEPKR